MRGRSVSYKSERTEAFAMTRRVSLVLDDEMYEQLRARARRRRTTISAEMRAALGAALSHDQPNAGLAVLVGMVKHLRPGSAFASPAFREAMARHGAEKSASS